MRLLLCQGWDDPDFQHQKLFQAVTVRIDHNTQSGLQLRRADRRLVAGDECGGRHACVIDLPTLNMFFIPVSSTWHRWRRCGWASR